MAKVKKPTANKVPKKPIGPDHLPMSLFAPGMTALHRAGLGGLACTLKYIERAYQQGALSDDDVPGGPWDDGAAPWEIEVDQITLQFGEPESAGEYLRKLFALGFQIKEDLIYLPGQYTDLPPTLVARASLQKGIQLTYLQHGPTCGSREGERETMIEIDDKSYHFSHDVFTSYKHQGWFWLDRDEKSKETDTATGKRVKTGRRIKLHQTPSFVDDDGHLAAGQHAIDIKILPGAMTRHDRFKQSAVFESSRGLICLHFALVGSLTLPVNGITAVLIIPDVTDLLEFANSRPVMTPRGLLESRVGSGADAGLQLQVRLKARNLGLTGCHALTFRPTAWASQQKSRVESLYVPILTGRDFDIYELAFSKLSPRIATKTVKESTGKGKAKLTKERRESFRTDSVVRPIIAENLARGRPWYSGFARLMTAINPATDTPYRNQISFERKGLNDMVTDDRVWDDKGEALVVRAVHEAISFRLGQIRSETDGNRPLSQATKNRWDKFRERLRLDLCGAKTQGQVRFALCDLFSRAGRLPSLTEGWQALLPMLNERKWQLTRDLALLACASYSGKNVDPDESSPETK